MSEKEVEKEASLEKTCLRKRRRRRQRKRRALAGRDHWRVCYCHLRGLLTGRPTTRSNLSLSVKKKGPKKKT